MSRTPPDARFWAKLGEDAWHPLSAHLADVAAVCECLLRPGTALEARLARASASMPVDTSGMQRAVVLLAFLHDIGKVQHGFQWRRDRSAVIDASWRGHVRPVLDSVAFAPLRPRLTALASQVGDPNAVWAAICHHGRPYLNRATTGDPRVYWGPDGGRDPLAEWDRLARLATEFTGTPGAEVRGPWSPEALHLLAGVVTLADWVGSSERFFPFTPEADDDVRSYWDRTRERAAEACSAVGLVARRVTVAPGVGALAQLFPSTFPRGTPTILQQHLAEMPLPTPGTRLLVESDTGSGKTESALTLFARLRAEGRVDSLFFALPTRATASAMATRVNRFVGALYGDVAAPAVELSAGGRQSGIGTAVSPATQYPDESDPALLERWTSQSNRHRSAAEIVVGTIDQALLACLAARHSHLRLAGLARALLVVDEVHAFDRYMTTVLRHLTDLHTSLGGVVLFMSATLASVARQELGTEAVRAGAGMDHDEAVARAYPSLSSLAPGDSSWQETSLPAPASRTRRIRWSPAGEVDALGAAAAAAAAGARVLVLRNTVSDARRSVLRLADLGADNLLWRPRGAGAPVAYHARYTRSDRTALDAAVLEDFGPGSTARGVILVATQVAEQSLDIDFDLLISDLAPVDVLIQRIGRMHRHVRPDRAGFDEASAVIIEPGTNLSEVVERRRATSTLGHGTVYPDLGDLELTRRLVVSRPAFVLPEQSRLLVEDVYHPSRRAALGEESAAWAAHLDRRDGEGLGAVTHAEVCVVRFDLPYTHRENVARFGTLDDGGGAAEAAVRTRLGDDRVSFELPEPVPNLFGVGGPQDSHVDLGVRVFWRAGLRSGDIAALHVEDWSLDELALRFRLGPVQVCYAAGGWEWRAT